jgi:hypothetical protein
MVVMVLKAGSVALLLVEVVMVVALETQELESTHDDRSVGEVLRHLKAGCNSAPYLTIYGRA